MSQSAGEPPVVSEEIDTNWQQREALLQRIGVELSKLCQVADPKLQVILSELRDGLGAGGVASDLGNSADALFAYLRTAPALLDSGSSEGGEYIRIAEALQDLFEELQVPVANFNDAQTLTAAAGKAKSLDEIVSVLNRGVVLLKDINQFVDEKPGDSPAADAVAAPAPAEAPVASASGKSRKSSWLKQLTGRQPSAEQIFDALRPLLDSVLDKVASLDGVSRQVVMIKAQLPSVREPQDMQKVLEQVLNLLAGIAAGLSKERKETESFLGELREKLQGIEQGIAATVDTEGLGRAENLHAGIGSEVEGIQQAVQSDGNADEVRSLIEQRIEAISGSLDAFLVEERERHEESERKVKDLTRKLREMEVESQQLRAQVQEKQLAVTKDPLTGATNRFGFDERFEEEIGRSRRIGFPLSIIMVDVDNFKQVNDTYGHKAGDLVLQKVVQVMKANVRKTDCIARYGGDEFVLILPDTPAEGAANVAEKLRTGVENCGFHNNGQPVKVTLCCGVTQVRADDSAEDAFERADGAMYSVKRDKRNGVKLA